MRVDKVLRVLGQLVELLRRQECVEWNPLKTAATRRADRRLVVGLRVPNYFEDLALITEAGGLDPLIVSRNFVALARREWDFWGPAMTRMREDDEFAFIEFENLVVLMEKLAAKQGQPAS